MRSIASAIKPPPAAAIAATASHIPTVPRWSLLPAGGPTPRDENQSREDHAGAGLHAARTDDWRQACPSRILLSRVVPSNNPQ